MEQNKRFEISSFVLHILAMIFMLCDHLWATIVPGNEWLTCIGRIAYPIFAFMIVEGYFHTKKLKQYVLRLLIFAALSEIPFNLMTGGSLFNLLHQNVLWTFLIGVGLIHLIERARQNPRKIGRWLLAALGLLLGCAIALVGMTDYMHFGVLTILVFYLFRGRRWWCYVGQLVCLWFINIEMMGGIVYPIELFGNELIIHQQGFALLALLPIWLYQGKQGMYNKAVKYTYYAFYPVHLLILYLLMLVLH